MTHLPFVASSYALGIAIPAAFAIAAWARMAAARQRLVSVDPRRARTGMPPRQ